MKVTTAGKSAALALSALVLCAGLAFADDEPQPTPTPTQSSEENNSYRDQGETEGSCNCGGVSMTTNNFSANELYVP